MSSRDSSLTRSCSPKGNSWIEVNSFVEMPHLNVASLFISISIGKFGQIITSHSEQINQFFFVGMIHKNFNKGLDEPGTFLRITLRGISCGITNIKNFVKLQYEINFVKTKYTFIPGMVE